jgi:hypothetical protein
VRADFTSLATGGEMKVYDIAFPDSFASLNLEMDANAEVEEKRGKV